MGSPRVLPFAISNTPDSCLSEGKIVLPFQIDAASGSQWILDLSGVSGQRQLSAIKGLYVAFPNTQDASGKSLIIKVTVLDTQQVIYLGSPNGFVAGGNAQSYVVCSVPLFANTTSSIQIDILIGNNSGTPIPVNFSITNFDIPFGQYSVGS